MQKIFYDAYLYQYNKDPILIGENLNRHSVDNLIANNVCLGNIIVLEVVSKSHENDNSYLEPYEKYCVKDDVNAVQRCGSAIIMSYIYQVEEDGTYHKLDIDGFVWDKNYIKKHSDNIKKHKRNKLKNKTYKYLNENLINEIENIK